jgi:hypothetical protein
VIVKIQITSILFGIADPGQLFVQQFRETRLTTIQNIQIQGVVFGMTLSVIQIRSKN